MHDQRKGLPESEELAEQRIRELASRKWVRKRWRKRAGDAVTTCVLCRTSLNRKDTYYVRPAYTDGTDWICSGCFDRLSALRETGVDHRYGKRRFSE